MHFSNDSYLFLERCVDDFDGGGVRGPRCGDDDDDVRRLRFRSRLDRFRCNGEVLNKIKTLFFSFFNLI